MHSHLGHSTCTITYIRTYVRTYIRRNSNSVLVTISVSILYNTHQVHGRSREQRYTKVADWEYIRTCAAAAQPVPLFGNGDVLSFEEYNHQLQASGVDGIMIARYNIYIHVL